MSSDYRINTENRPLLIIAGPTGAGKSDIAVRLALKLDAEIISADSVAVYRGFDIGSAKPDEHTRELVKHHLIDILRPEEYFGADEFVRLARQAVCDIYTRGRLPIVTGGTAFYIQALLYDVNMTDEPEHDHDYRDALYREAALPDGREALHDRLKAVDPDYAHGVHPNNVKRVIRALEYNHYTGRLFSEYNREQSLRSSPYLYCYTALTMPREKLYERINLRVGRMLEAGLVQEVEGLLKTGVRRDCSPMLSIGYKEITAYLYGECTLSEAADTIRQNSRRYAKRQLTWLRRERDVVFLEPAMGACDDRADVDSLQDETTDRVIELMLQRGMITYND